jgi:hypothetical protein
MFDRKVLRLNSHLFSRSVVSFGLSRLLFPSIFPR